ncbi:aldolase [Cytobacillus firmus]|uniref:aldolase n=1 Tax=Cytobacillus firmus TaxID=1399 RepID=UPI001CFE81A8|nr:aldolase [Cytobacillus firmus]URT70232.1 aldolase [Cytobacillus firmus]
MQFTLQKECYRAFGLNIQSEIPLPELPILTNSSEEFDTVIQLRDLKELWNKEPEPNCYFKVSENSVLFQIPDTAIFLVENGERIIVSPRDGASEDKIRLYVLGTCMGALLMQRKILPLHGSAIAIKGRAYAIVGDAGAGKSTLASAFLNKGYQLLSDDVIPIALSKENIAMVTPAYPQQKLWQESITAFGMEPTKYKPIFERETKYAVPVTSRFSSESIPLSGVIELVKTDSNEIELIPLSGLQRIYTLFNHTYRNFLIDRLGLREWHFSLTSNLANKIEHYQLQRPVNRFTASELTFLILNTIERGEKE